MEGNAVQRNTVLVFLLLDVDTVRVVRTDFVKRQDVQHDQAEQNDRQGDHVQGEEAVQGDAGNQEVTADPLSQILADHRNGAEQRDDHLGTPVGHLAPRQQIAHEGFSHQAEVDQHAEDPHQLSRLLIGAVHQAAEHVQVDNDEERRRTRGVHVADDPAVVDITHDVFDGGECFFRRRGKAHGQPDTGEDLVNQDEQRQGTEEVPEVEVLRGVVLAQMVFPHLGGGEAGIDPSHELVHQAFSWSTPMVSTSPSSA
ncbi:hypothetical protein D3C78_918330 [compost metagenome]